MIFIKVRAFFLVSFLLLTLTLLSGCGSGTPNVVVNNGPSVSLDTSNGSEYVIKAVNFIDVAGMVIAINYNSSTYSSPTVTQGRFISGALMASNVNNPGAIKIAVISTSAFSGTGEVATVSFVTTAGAGDFPTVSARLYNTAGAEIL